MADLTDVANALVNVCVAAIYPSGTSQPPVGGVQAKVYQGWPEPAALSADLAAHVANVTIFPSPQEKITTRRIPDWQVLVAPAPTLTATVTPVGKTITIGGTVSVPQAVVIVVDGVDYAYGVQVTDTLTTIAASLATLVSANQSASSASGVITVPGAHSMGAQIVASGTSGSEVALEARTFTISVWADCFDRREPLAKLLTPVLAGLYRLAMPDGSTATCEYAGSLQVDTEQKQGIYRRDIKLTIEYATIATRTDTTVGVVVLHRTLSINGGISPLGNVLVGNAVAVLGAGGSTSPVNTVAPTVTGTPTVGQTLTANPGTWTGTPSPAYTYVWNRGGTAISGATGATYALVTADLAALISATVTATNSVGTASATSVSVGPVTSADVTPPVLSTALIAGASPSVVALTYNKALNTTAPATSAFSIGGTLASAKTVATVSISGAVVSITMSSAFVSTDVPTITYVVPGSNQIKDLAGNNASAFAAQAVTNNVSAGGGAYATLKAAALAAATANNASLWFLGNASDLTGNVFTDAAGTIQAGAGSQVGYLKDRNGNTYPQTQSTVISCPTIALNGAGYYVLALSGSQLLTSGRVFTQAQNSTVIGVAGAYDNSASRTIFGVGDNSSNYNSYPQLALNNGVPAARFTSDAGDNTVSGSAVSNTLPPPIAVVKTGTTAVLWVKGVSTATITSPTGSASMTAGNIGAFPTQNNLMNGQIALVCAAPVAMSNADRQSIEAFGALLTGTAYP